MTVLLYCSEPPLVGFECSLGPEGVTVLCTSSLNDTMVPVTYTCSYDDGPEEDCMLKLCLHARVQAASFDFCAGGPGPEIGLPLDRFEEGVDVRVKVTIVTNGGQSQDSTVVYTVKNNPVLRCSESIDNAVIRLSCVGVPEPVVTETATCSINDSPETSCECVVVCCFSEAIFMRNLHFR